MNLGGGKYVLYSVVHDNGGFFFNIYFTFYYYGNDASRIHPAKKNSKNNTFTVQWTFGQIANTGNLLYTVIYLSLYVRICRYSSVLLLFEQIFFLFFPQQQYNLRGSALDLRRSKICYRTHLFSFKNV